MQVPDHLIQIVSQPYQLAVNQTLRIVVSRRLDRGRPNVGIKEKRTPKMNRTHANFLGATLDVLKLLFRETEIKLPRAGFTFYWAAHDGSLLAERMRPGVSGAIASATERDPLPRQRDISLPSPDQPIIFDLSIPS